ncbi:MAG: hypothetical protein ACLFSQ_11120 [Candidatus Zixiibacteriota bacterium]
MTKKDAKNKKSELSKNNISQKGDKEAEKKVSENHKKNDKQQNSRNLKTENVEAEIEHLRHENQILHTRLLLTSKGADPEQIGTLMRLWDEPEIQEDIPDENKKAIYNEYVDSFKEKFPWGFLRAEEHAPVETDSRRFTPSSKLSQAEMAKQKAIQDGDIQKMLAMNKGKKRN